MGVCGFGVESSCDTIILFLYCDIEEVGFLQGEIGGEFDGSVEGIEVVNEFKEGIFLPGPDAKIIIDVAPPDPWTTRG